MDIERARKYIKRVKWVYAKSMPKMPHDYTVSDWNRHRRDEFEWFVKEIRKHGYTETYFGTDYIYLDVDGWKYWTMGSPLNETILINRAEL